MSTLRVVEQAKRASLMKQATSITKSQMLSVCWPLLGTLIWNAYLNYPTNVVSTVIQG